jgi:hypothetical protein
MTQPVIHQPRVAWDGARAFVRAAGSVGYHAFADQVAILLGPAYYGELAHTRQRLLTARVDENTDGHVADAEVGIWRARLEDLLRTHPDLAGTIQDLAEQVSRP